MPAASIRSLLLRFPCRLAIALLAVLLAGCADLPYYGQSVSGHLAMLRAAKPVDEWLAGQDKDTQATPELKARLQLAQRMRRFAVTELHLPDNASYTRYADLRRSAVVWNVVAAPALSLQLKTWCFPVMGCVGYRGYFAQVQAQSLADTLKAEGLEVSVYGVPAYSTLGWMNWAGGDPLLNTFITYPEQELAGLIFHELAHQVVYAQDDTMFNESFATAVERLGGARWMAQAGSSAASAASASHRARRQEFRALTLAMRNTLNSIYQENSAIARISASKLAIKTEAMARFKADYQTLRQRWVADAGLSTTAANAALGGFDAWVANANNASFAVQAAYDELVPQFEALYARIAQDAGQGAAGQNSAWPLFYDAVKRLAVMAKAERRAALLNPQWR